MRIQKPVVPMIAVLAVIMVDLIAAPAARAAAPTITSFAPTSGGYNTLVTINGSNFVAPATVTFAGTAGTAVTVVSAVKITARVPRTATSGPISVSDSGGSATTAASFTVLPWLSPKPAAQHPGGTVAVTLGAFAPSEAVDLYAGTANVGLAVTDGAGAVTATVTVPRSAPPGDLSLTAIGRRSGLAAQQTVVVRTNWTQYGNGPQHAGANPFENVLSVDSVSGLDESWGGGAAPASGAAIADGMLYVGASAGRIVALDVVTGAVKWSYQTFGEVRSTPAVVGGIVYAGSGDGNVYALDAATGALRWSYTTNGSVSVAPVVAGGRVFVADATMRLYALDAATGTFQWFYQFTSALTAAAYVNGAVYVATASSVYCINATTGGSIWGPTSAGPSPTAPAVVGGRVFIGNAGGYLIAFNRFTGAQLWSQNSTASPTVAPVVAGGIVYWGTQNSGGGLVSADTVKGGAFHLWSSSLDSPVVAPPVLADGVVYVGTADHTVYALDAADGRQLWSAVTGGTPLALQVVDGHLFVESQNYSVYSYTLSASDPPAARPGASGIPDSPR